MTPTTARGGGIAPEPPTLTHEFIQRVTARMAFVDRQTPAIRALINEHGLTIMRACLDCGVTKPNRIAHLIRVFTETGLYGNGRAGER